MTFNPSYYETRFALPITLEEREAGRVERERRRVEQLAEQLRTLGVEPDFGDDAI